jgi:putative molybdenum carrier protein
MTLTVLSTAQHGAERGALQAAIDLGLMIDGWRCAGDDTPPIFATMMRETSSSDRGMARRLCVQDSDGTLALSGSIASVGVVAFLDRVTEQQGKPFMSVVLGDKLPEAVRGSVLDWIRDNSIARLYVAGPAEDDEPGVEARARNAVKFLLEPLALDQLGKFIDVVKLLEGAVDSDQPKDPVFHNESTLEDVAARVSAVGGRPSHVAIPLENVDVALAAGLAVECMPAQVDSVEERARAYHALVVTAPGPIGVAEHDDEDDDEDDEPQTEGDPPA